MSGLDLTSGENSRSGKKCSHFNFPSKHKRQASVAMLIFLDIYMYNIHPDMHTVHCTGQSMVHWLWGT